MMENYYVWIWLIWGHSILILIIFYHIWYDDTLWHHNIELPP